METRKASGLYEPRVGGGRWIPMVIERIDI
eukprot:SAG11_NODE_35587_length_266_cov_0.544910_1_plen_29_part_01